MEKVNLEPGIINFFIKNPVAANLLMAFIIILGAISYQATHKQIFPALDVDTIAINVTQFGASAKEIEENVISKIEHSLMGLPEVKRMRSWSRESSGELLLELQKSAEPESVLDKVKLAVDATPSFPADLEPIVINLREHLQPVIRLALVHSEDDNILRRYALEVKQELLNLKNVAIVNDNLSLAEVAIEVSPIALQMYHLTMDDIRLELQKYSNNLSVGAVRTESGVIPLRVENQAYKESEFAQIPIKTFESGLQIKLQDIATIQKRAVEGTHVFSFSDKPAVSFDVVAAEYQDAVAVVDSVNKYVKFKNQHLPHKLSLEVIIDGTAYLDERLSMMENNLIQGAILVLLVLSLFLSIRLALWVVVGLPVCFLGAALVMPVFDVTINLVSLFAFIMVLGLIVDDAIVVGESVYGHTTFLGHSKQAVALGVKKVAKPAVFGVLTTIAVFFPFVFSNGSQSELFKGISVIVIFCLVFSIIESKLILPSHLAGLPPKKAKKSGFKYQLNCAISNFSRGWLANKVMWSLQHKWSMLLLFISIFVLSVSLIQFGYVKSVPDPMVPIDQPEVTLELNDNASTDIVEQAAKAFQAMLKAEEQKTIAKFGRGMIQDILIESVGQTELKFTIILVDEERRPYDTFELSRRWRENIPDIVALKAIRIKDDVLGQNNLYGDFGYFLYSDNIGDLNAAAKLFAAELKQQSGLYEVGSTISVGRKELLMELKPLARKLNLTLAEVARQLHQTHSGAEADRFSYLGEEIRVMVRYPQSSRASISELQYVRIKLGSGEEVFLGDVVNFKESQAVTTLRREAGKRSLYVFASIDHQQVNGARVMEHVKSELLPKVKAKYPSVTTDLGGKVKEVSSEKDQMLTFFVASLLAVYILLAIPLKSYFQPLLIMSVIPFCIVGAIWGHWIFAEDFSLVSIFGLIAAAGVVVNDSLILVDRINEKMNGNLAIEECIKQAVHERFRAILLTSLTTFLGLLPIMFETSLQAKFVSPMAISLGFAVLVSTLVTLFLVPILYVIGLRVKPRISGLSPLKRYQHILAVKE
ncbi:efflux RND transporter permease subunit [Pseudoalteromonas sp. UG3-1]